ncbi:hypothetical protein QJS66_16000 [Kocuria rhizophila]|nr:hypothetical protein QJS66_16000 [Kocuria rhizophila]
MLASLDHVSGGRAGWNVGDLHVGCRGPQPPLPGHAAQGRRRRAASSWRWPAPCGPAGTRTPSPRTRRASGRTRPSCTA